MFVFFFFPSVIHFFFHFDYVKLGHVGGSGGDSESDQWGAPSSRSHQSVVKVRAPELVGYVHVGPHPKPEQLHPTRVEFPCLPLKHKPVYFLVTDTLHVVKAFYE